MQDHCFDVDWMGAFGSCPSAYIAYLERMVVESKVGPNFSIILVRGRTVRNLCTPSSL